MIADIRTGKRAAVDSICGVLIAVALGFCFGCRSSNETSGNGGSPSTPTGVSPKESFAGIISPLMTKWGIRGGTVALMKEEKLLMVEGYGQADEASNTAAGATSLYRIASLSKPITAVAVLKLVEQGLLALDDKAFGLLGYVLPVAGEAEDSRLHDITIRDLLQHSAGWDANASGYDPMFKSREIAAAMGVPTPPDAATIVGYMVRQPLDYSPGTKYVYSNFGYCVLGRIIEQITGKTYEAYVKEDILGAAGITGMRIGRSLQANKASGEVTYYDYPGALLAPSVFTSAGELVPWPYGGFCLEAMDAHGGWIASAVDLMRFVAAVDGGTVRTDVLQKATIDLMVARPSLPDWQSSSWFYALGWNVRPTSGDANWWHTGRLPGTATILVRTYNKMAWAALFNSAPSDYNGFLNELDSELWRAVNGVTSWPTTDLFSNYPSTPVRGSLSASTITDGK